MQCSCAAASLLSVSAAWPAAGSTPHNAACHPPWWQTLCGVTRCVPLNCSRMQLQEHCLQCCMPLSMMADISMSSLLSRAISYDACRQCLGSGQNLFFNETPSLGHTHACRHPSMALACSQTTKQYFWRDLVGGGANLQASVRAAPLLACASSATPCALSSRCMEPSSLRASACSASRCVSTSSTPMLCTGQLS